MRTRTSVSLGLLGALAMAGCVLGAAPGEDEAAPAVQAATAQPATSTKGTATTTAATTRPISIGNKVWADDWLAPQ